MTRHGTDHGDAPRRHSPADGLVGGERVVAPQLGILILFLANDIAGNEF